jgi:hypothetical protein
MPENVMPDTLPNLGLPLLQPAQAQKHVTHNEALRILDTVAQLSVLDRDRQAPPAAPALGDRHIVAAAATGAWIGRDYAVATWNEDNWQFDVPVEGWIGFDRDASEVVYFNGTEWLPFPSPSTLSGLTGLGIGAVPDTTNRLSVTAPAVLLNHEGAGHQLKINKATTADTASLLYQTGFSGRAEMGLAGNNRFSVKTSANGSAWLQQLELNPSPAQVGISPNGTVTALFGAANLTLSVPMVGTAVQQDANDATAGRLMLAQHGVLRSGVLGTVSQVAGVPTGAIVESGSNASGRFVRWADGTQICTRSVVIDINTDNGQDFAFPASFASIQSGGVCGTVLAEGNTTGRIDRCRALGSLPVFIDPTGWRVRLAEAIAADTISVGLTATGRWY